MLNLCEALYIKYALTSNLSWMAGCNDAMRCGAVHVRLRRLSYVPHVLYLPAYSRHWPRSIPSTDILAAAYSGRSIVHT